MRDTMDSLTIESSILRDLADFDTSAPINATILFDNDNDENTDILIKSEHVTEDDTSQIKLMPNRLDVAVFEVKKKIKEEPIESSEEVKETNFNQTIQQNVAKENNTYQVEDLHTKISNTDDSRKRKQKQLQIYKNKKAAKNSAEINSSNNLCTQNNLSKDQSEIGFPSSEYSMLESNQCFRNAPQNPPQSKYAEGLSDSSVLLRNIVNSQNGTEICMSTVSEYMRKIISAYYHQRQNPTFKEDYKQLKNKLFTFSYNTVVEKLLPEENNTQFIKDFVKSSHQRASEKSTFKCFYEDYSMLLRELMEWTKKKMSQTSKKADQISEQPNLTVNNMDRKVDIPPLQNNGVKLNNSGKSENVESVCIFSSGSPGREISINIDPTLQLTAKNIKKLTVISPPNQSKGTKIKEQELENLQNNLVTSKVYDSEGNQGMTEKSVNPPTLPLLDNLPEIIVQLLNNPDFKGMQQSLKETLNNNNDTPAQPLPPSLLQIPNPLDIQHTQPPPVQSLFGQSTNYGQSSLVQPPNSQLTNLQQQPLPAQRMQQQHREPPVNSQSTNLQQQPLPSQRMQQQHREPPIYSQSTNLQQQPLPSQRMQQQHREPPVYSQSTNLQQQPLLSQRMQQQHREPPVYSQSTNLQQQPLPSQRMQQQHREPPVYSQSTNLQQQPLPSQRMQQQHNEPPPYSQYANLQQQLGQSQIMQQQYREHGNVRTQQLEQVQIHHGQLQQAQPQLGHPQYGSQQYRQPDHGQSQYGPSQHEQRLYSQPALLKYGHSNDMQRQVVQSEQVPPLNYEQLHHLPPQNGQPKIVQSQVRPPYRPYARPNVGQSQSSCTHYEQWHHNRPANGHTKRGPPRTRQMQPLRPQHYEQSQHMLPQYEQSKYFPLQAGQSQHVLPSYNQTDCLKSLLDKPPRLDWHQELNALYNQGQIQSQNQKSSPRSASTDSGFISPLNFNVPADQTPVTPDCATTKQHAPVWEPPTEQSETPSLLITHVTSLNPEVCFIKEGSCVVCKTLTKHKCMGCMKHYYCTYKCQLLDWSSHGPNCEKKSEQ